jgi:hypothetical protein
VLQARALEHPSRECVLGSVLDKGGKMTEREEQSSEGKGEAERGSGHRFPPNWEPCSGDCGPYESSPDSGQIFCVPSDTCIGKDCGCHLFRSNHFDADSPWEHVAGPGHGVTKQPDYDYACFCGNLSNPS